MHLFCMTRGEKDAVRTMMEDVSAQFWPMTTSAKTTHVNTIVQPIQLWSLVVPEGSLDVLQKTLHTNDFARYHGKKGVKPYALDSAAVFTLRKMLRCEKAPKIKVNANFRFIRKSGVEVLPIGIKRDNTIHSELKCEGL